MRQLTIKSATPGWGPSIVPHPNDASVYLVVDDYGPDGQVWREMAADRTDLETVLNDLMTGQFHAPDRVVAFNVGDRWADDVSRDIARELRLRADLTGQDLSETLTDFVQRHIGAERQLVLRLA